MHDKLFMCEPLTLPAGGHGRCCGPKADDHGRAYVVSGAGKAKALPFAVPEAGAAGPCRSLISVCAVPVTTDVVRGQGTACP